MYIILDKNSIIIITKWDPKQKQRSCRCLTSNRQLRALVQFGNVKVQETMKDKTPFPGFQSFSQMTLYRHSKYPLDGRDPVDKRKLKKGRPRLLNERDQLAVKRQLGILRELEGTFTSARLQASFIPSLSSVSNATFRRQLRRMGYGYRSIRKKGQLTKKDLKKRLEFAKNVKRVGLGLEFWKKGISFYLDATGFIYKKWVKLSYDYDYIQIFLEITPLVRNYGERGKDKRTPPPPPPRSPIIF